MNTFIQVIAYYALTRSVFALDCEPPQAGTESYLFIFILRSWSSDNHIAGIAGIFDE